MIAHRPAAQPNLLREAIIGVLLAGALYWITYALFSVPD